jgi:hypothetical protein
MGSCVDALLTASTTIDLANKLRSAAKLSPSTSDHWPTRDYVLQPQRLVGADLHRSWR